MKNYFIAAILIALLTACQHEEASTPTPDNIIGTWKLTETYFDPGDGSGKFSPASFSRTITFFPDSTYQTDIGLRTFAPISGPENGDYLPEKAVIVILNDSTNRVEYPYQLEGLHMNLIHTSCQDSCAERYVKVRNWE